MYAEDNLLLGSITVPVPVGPEGKEKVRVRYTYDINGILVVDVHVVSTGQEKQLVIRNDKIKLSEKELKKRNILSWMVQILKSLEMAMHLQVK